MIFLFILHFFHVSILGIEDGGKDYFSFSIEKKFFNEKNTKKQQIS